MNKRLSEVLAETDSRGWRGGRRCGVCSHRRRKEIEEDLMAVAKAKRSGPAVPWTFLYRAYFKPEYKFSWVRPDSLKSHLANCLGIKR